MIKVLIEPRKVNISGHANSAPEGEDLVCCAVSTLYASLVTNLKNDVKKEKNNDIEFSGLKGDAFVKVKKFSTKCYYSIKFFRIAIKELAKEYNNYIEVEDRIDISKNINKKI